MRLGNMLCLLGIVLIVMLAGCGGDSQKAAPASSGSDEEQIQALLTEIITRWHYGDKAALYDNEFEYVRDRITFDDYLKRKELMLDADTVQGINVKTAHIYDKDSAVVDVEIVFEGPTGKISKVNDTYYLYYENGRWIRPTIGVYEGQQQYEMIRRQADSAAAAEAEDDD